MIKKKPSHLIKQKNIKSKRVDIKNEAGFSLVEISMALLIMGLIIGGILKGQELLESARLKSITAQVNEYRVAVTVFQDRYDALPGDYAHAKEYISDTLINGNGDGLIQGEGLSEGGEALAFWSHLAAANLISSPGQSASKGVVSFGQGAPKAKIGGGFTVSYDAFGEGRHWFVLGEKKGASGNGGGVTPLQAMSIDVKGDDGNPKQGKIRAKEGIGFAAGSCVTPQGTYNGKNKDKACVLYFQF